MGHNYAKPARAEGRLAQLFARLPDAWGVEITRAPRGGWCLSIHRGDEGAIAIPPQPTILEAWEEAWRVIGPPPKIEP